MMTLSGKTAVFILSLLLSCDGYHQIYPTGLIGCFIADQTNPEFTTYASHLDQSALTPKKCSAACHAINYQRAAILNVNMCFCKQGTTVNSTVVANSFCQSSVCPGEEALYCGANGYYLVYEAMPMPPDSAVINIDSAFVTDLNNVNLSSVNGLEVYSTVNMVLAFTGPATRTYLLENNELTRTTTVGGLTTISFQQQLERPGIRTLQFVVSNGGENSLASTRIAIGSPEAVDPISGFALNCLNTTITTNDYLMCDISFKYGTNLKVKIDFGDGNIEEYSWIGFGMIPYGLPVPKVIIDLVNENLASGPKYVALNAEIKVKGYLRALEIYAESPGDIKLGFSGEDGSLSNKDYDQVADNLAHTFDCVGSSYSHRYEHCLSISKSDRVNLFIFRAGIISRTLTLNAGYNLFTINQLGDILVYPGWVPYFEFLTGKIAVDPATTNELSDCSYTTGPCIPLPSNRRLYVRTLVTAANKGATVFHKYTNPGAYNLQVNISNIKLTNSESTTAIVTVTVPVEPITGLTLLTLEGTTSCLLDISCGFQSSILTGNQVSYVFYVDQTSFNILNESTFYYTFSTAGVYIVNVTATNSVSSMSYSISVMVSGEMSGLSFKSGSMPWSSSIVGQPAEFLFVLVFGSNYQCLVGYGDGSSAVLSDAIAPINNTYISHTYTSESVYNVTVLCNNTLGPLGISFLHYVQYPLVGLALTSNGVTQGVAYSVGFSLQSGSAPHLWSLFFNGVLDTTASYSNLLGRSSNRAPEFTPTIHNIFINMTNYVSNIQLNASFEISTSLQNVQFSVTPTTGISSFTFEFPTSLSLVTTMQSGSNVNIFIDADSLSSPSSLPNNTVSVQTVGQFVSPFTINYQYANPGAYTIRANISNLLVSFGFIQAVRFISRVDNLVPRLSTNTNKVVFESYDGGVTGRALAQFVFGYLGDSKAGSDASVTFWPGDSTNSSFGPFALNMDFNANTSRSPLQYTYNALGDYTAVFLVTNPLGSKFFTLTFTVVYSLMGFYIDVSPAFVEAGTPVNVNAYLVQGDNVQYTWTRDGVQFGTGAKTSTSYVVPDTRQFTPMSAGNYSLSVSATDTVNAVTVSQTFLLQVQSRITSMTASVNPSTPQTNIDNMPSSRTFSFTINLTPSPPIGVFYVIDFGDGSPIGLPTFMPTSSAQRSYTYSASGIYTVNVTTFNRLSSITRLLTVQIYSNFTGFSCAPNWRQFPSDSVADYPYAMANGVYSVKAEYDIRFFCTWLRLDATPTEFELYLNGSLVQTITNVSSLTRLSTSTTTGFIVPYLSSNIANGNITVVVKNPSFTQSYAASIAPYSALSNVQWMPLESAFQAGANQSLRLEFQSLGEPSCVLISFTTSNNITTNLGLIGSSNNTCLSFYPTLIQLYLGTYASMSASNILTLTTSGVNRVGNHRLTARIINSQASLTATTNITAVAQLGLCEIPNLDILNRSSLFYQPKSYLRSDIIVLSGITNLNCSSGLANNKLWSIFLIDELTGNEIRQVTFPNNPTVNYAELVIDSNTLGYGVYRAVYQVTMQFNSIYTSYVESYFRIAPAGLVISSLFGAPGGGTFETTRGIGQTIELTPTVFSRDIDGVANINSLRFRFFCQVIDNGVAVGFPQLFFNQNLDLLTIKNNFSSNTAIQQLLLSTTTPSCFTNINGFSFDVTNNSLTVAAGSLAFVQNRKYQFLVQTTYLGVDYFQNVIFEIQNVNFVPLLTLSCKFSDACVPYGGYVKINPNTELILKGDCFSGCTNLLDIKYQYNTYQSWSLSPTSSQTIWYFYQNTSQLLGQTTMELNAQSSLFLTNPNIYLWKFEFTLTSTTPTNGIATGESSMVVLVNQLPYGGTCSVSPISGVALNTTFTISCSSWADNDGNIAKYAFFASVSGQQAGLGLGTTLNGVVTTTLPAGSPTDSNRLNIYVNIIDNDRGITTHYISTPVEVVPDLGVLNSVVAQLSNPTSTGPINNILASGNSQLATSVLLSVSSLLNSVSITTNTSDNSSMVSINEQSALRDYLATFVNNLSISDINSISNQAALLTSLTAASGEVTRNTADAVTNQAIRLIQSLTSMIGTVSTQQLQFAAIGITNALGNVITGLSTYLNGRQDNLDLDYQRAIDLPDYYNTDLEDYWTNPNNFFGIYGEDAGPKQFNTQKNVAKQQYLNVDVAQKVSTITDLIANLVAQRFAVGQSFSIISPSITFQLEKLIAANLSSNVNLKYARISLPTFCDLMVNSKQVTTTTTRSPFINLEDSNNCTNRIITLKSVLLPLATSGHNGRNESYIGDSYGLELSFLDQDGLVIPVQNLLTPIELWIPRLPSSDETAYQFVNTTNFTINSTLQIMPNYFNISSTNASVHIHIKPSDLNAAYLVLIKLGSTPFLNQNSSSYDFWKILCPGSSDYHSVNDTTNGFIDSYYLVFLNMAQMRGYRGFLGYGVRELSGSEKSQYCNNSIPMPSWPPVLPSSQNHSFSSGFSLKTYTSGCYYYNPSTGKWSNDGMEIFVDSTLVMTHCTSLHLTQFAGGLVVVPTTINFVYFVENASPAKNPTIYAVVLSLVAVYVVCLVWAHLGDFYEKKRLIVNVLEDNTFGDIYSYEIIVFTGNRREAATDSKVKMIINGDNDETNERLLESKSGPVFRKGGMDSFLMTVSRPLGKLNYVRIWHDNSGMKEMASWYLKFVIVHDLQTREKFYFPCFNWLAVERGDGKINRTLGVAGRKQILDLAIHAQKNMSDGHLWFSVFSKPVYSTLSRVDRVACCFLILYVFMLANILYYDVDPTPDIGGFQLGPFYFTTTQLAIAIMVNLMVVVPSLVIIFLLKRSKVRLTKSRKLKDAIEVNMRSTSYQGFSSIKHEPEIPEFIDNSGGAKFASKYVSEENPNGVKWKRKFLLPWWSRILVHILCNIAILAAVFFIIVKGVNFGDRMVQKWLAALVVTFFTSIILIQPLQVIAAAFLFKLIFKRKRDLTDIDFENDHEDTGKNLNKYWRFEDIDDDKINPFKLAYVEAYQFSEHQLQEARKSRLREIRIRQAIKEIVIYFLFMAILFYINYTNLGKSAFDYQDKLKQRFAIDDFSTISEFWDWAMNTLAVQLRATKWYNSQEPFGLAGYLNDYVSRMIGYGVMRQIRVGNSSCSINNHMRTYIDFCNADYNLFVTDSNKYGFGWSPYNESFVPPHGTRQIYNAFQYKDAAALGGYPVYGEYNSYAGDGFVYELRGNMKFLQGNLSLLQQMGWVDRQTRAVIFEFAVYNPNINMLAVASILVEFLPTGEILTLSRFDPLNLFNEVNSSEGSTFKIIVYVVYMALITYFAICEIIELVKNGFVNYFKQFWNYIEWMLILLSYLSFGLFLYRLSVAYQVLDFFKRTSGYGYMNLAGINTWNQVLTIALALCCALGSLRLLKLFRFYKKIYALALTLKHCIKELLGFGLMFVFIWVAFVQMLYLYFYDKMESYSNPLNAFTFSFECLVGKFDRNLKSSAEYTLGPFIFVLYPIVMAFMIINIFVTIVCDSFKEVRFEINKHENDLMMVAYFRDKIRDRFGDKTARSRVHNDKYLEPAHKLPRNVDRLIDNLSRAYEEHICVDRMLERTKSTGGKK